MATQLQDLSLDIDFAALPIDRLHAMHDAGADVLECHRVLANTGDNIVGELLRDQDTFYEWNHYPDGDVFDPNSNAQYYYHAHPQELRGGEHGHFHTFLRPQGMPSHIRPAIVPNLKLPDGDNEALSHLIAISMDPHGIPQRLFTTNRWVTGEVWYAERDVCAMLEFFVIDHVRPSWAVNRWISGMVRLFRPQIAALLSARDAAVAGWAAAHPGADVYEDRGLEITSSVDISIDDQIAAIEAALADKV